MKHIEEYEKIIKSLSYHIDWLEGEISRLRNDRLANEIAEYNRLERCNGCDKRIAELVAENQALKHELDINSKMQQATKVPKARKVKKQKRNFKTTVICCAECHKYFQAKTKRAKFCPACRKEHILAYRREWVKKHRAAKKM